MPSASRVPHEGLMRRTGSASYLLAYALHFFLRQTNEKLGGVRIAQGKFSVKMYTAKKKKNKVATNRKKTRIRLWHRKPIIALTSNMVKLIEKVLHERITIWMVENMNS